VDAQSSLPVDLNKYGDAKPHLERRIGLYCSYCELRIENLPAVEHVFPKTSHGDLELVWSNFLFACGSCNSIKGHRDISLGDYVWPDRDNTARAFAYREGGVVAVAPDVPQALRPRANRTIALVGLDRTPASRVPATDADRRWRLRDEAFGMASRAKRRLRRRDDADLREQIVETACHAGFWSIWMTVFSDDPDMRCRLIAAFPGTSRECFDAQGCAVPRPGGML
jgi:uncharacterized protein (TIGR02646 family)